MEKDERNLGDELKVTGTNANGNPHRTEGSRPSSVVSANPSATGDGPTDGGTASNDDDDPHDDAELEIEIDGAVARAVPIEDVRPGAYYVRSARLNDDPDASAAATAPPEPSDAEDAGTAPPTVFRGELMEEEDGVEGEGGSATMEELVRRMAGDAPLLDGVDVHPVPDGEDGERPKDGGRGRLFAALAALVIAAALGWAVAAVATTPRKRGGAAAAADANEDDALLQTLDRFKELRQILAVGAVSDNVTFSDPASPQFRALSWLADEDEVLPSMTMTTTLTEEAKAKSVVQRYIMVLLYFSTDGENWAGANLAEAAAEHCYLWNVGCWEDLEAVGIAMERSGGRPYLSKDWHECDWEGVGCYEGTGIVGAISIGGNNLAGSIPQEIGSLKLLHSLDLEVNQVGGTIPDSIRNFGYSIVNIYLSFNLLTGSIPDFFDTLPNLARFSCALNFGLTGTIPLSINGHKNLKVFIVSYNQLTGTIPLDFATLPKLAHIDLGLNSLTGPIPPDIGKWKSAVYFAAYENMLTGTIPASIGNLSLLKGLDLETNQLTGTLPHSLADLRNLHGLNLVDNSLTGAIPPDFGNLSNLEVIGMDFNALSGTIPNSIGDLQKLIAMSLTFNGLTGTIPASMGTLPSLQFLLLGNNELVGTLPGTFTEADSLEFVYLGRSNLTGSMDFICDLNIEYVIADCGGDDAAEIVCHCCQVCCVDGEGLFGCDEEFLNTELSSKLSCMGDGILCGAIDEGI